MAHSGPSLQVLTAGAPLEATDNLGVATREGITFTDGKNAWLAMHFLFSYLFTVNKYYCCYQY